MARIICKSGMTGEQSRLRTRYGSFDEFESYSEMYNIHVRLGYKTASACYDRNPLVQSSTLPSDLRKVTAKQAEEAIRLYRNREARNRRKYLGK